MSSSGLLGKALKVESASPERKVIENALIKGFIANKIVCNFSVFFDNLQDSATEEDINDIQDLLSQTLPKLAGQFNLCRRLDNTNFAALIFTREPLNVDLYAHVIATELEKILIADFSDISVACKGISGVPDDLETFYFGRDT